MPRKRRGRVDRHAIFHGAGIFRFRHVALKDSDRRPVSARNASIARLGRLRTAPLRPGENKVAGARRHQEFGDLQAETAQSRRSPDSLESPRIGEVSPKVRTTLPMCPLVCCMKR